MANLLIIKRGTTRHAPAAFFCAYRVASFIFLAALALSTLNHSVAFAASRSTVTKLKEKRTLVDRHGRKFVCGKLSGHITSGVMQGGRLKSDSDAIKSLESQLRRARNSKTRRKLTQDINLLKARRDTCKKSFTAPRSTPTPLATPTSSSNPVAQTSTASGRGLDPVAIHLNGNTGGVSGSVTCNKITDPAGAVIDLFDGANCNVLVRPLDHHTTSASFKFSVTRQFDGKSSNQADASVSWDQSESFSGDYRSLAQYRDTLTKEEVAHLMRWVGFGANIDQAMQIGTAANGLNNLVDWLLTPRNCDAVEAEAAAIANLTQNRLLYTKSITDPNDSTKKIAAQYYTSNDNDGKTATSVASGFASWLHMMRYGCNPLRERMGLYFETQFPVNLSNYEDPTTSRYISDHIKLLRSGMPENSGRLIAPLRTLITRLHGTDGAMLRWLNNNSNYRSNGGNANYARELMELFLLGPADVITGAKNYNENDVTQMKFALMGYTEQDTNETTTRHMCCTPADGSPCGTNDTFPLCLDITAAYKVPIFQDTRWNLARNPTQETLFSGMPFAKTAFFKANSLVSGGDNLSDYLLYEHPGTARYIASRLITNFAGLDPTEQMVEEIAADLIANQYQFEPVLKKILTSSSFFSAEAQSDCVASPLETLVSFWRTLDLPLSKTTSVDMYADLRSQVVTSGEALLQSPSVFGYKSCGKITGNNVHTGEAWLTSQGLLGRFNSVPRLLNDLNATASSTGFSWKQFIAGSSWEQKTPQILLDSITTKLGIRLTESERSILMEYLNTVALTTVVDNGTTVPKATIQVNWGTLNQTQFDALISLKIPGLLELIYGMETNQVK